VAPDYPGFGQSSMPDRARFAYTFENLTNVVEELVEQLGLGPLSLYVMDYGAPIGYRLALRRPAQVRALVVQNGNAYEEGLREFWDPIKAYSVLGRSPPRASERAPRPGGGEVDALAVRERRARSEPAGSDDLARRPGRAGSARQPRDPDGPLLRLPDERAAVPRVPGLLPGAPAANPDRVGPKRRHLPPQGAAPYRRDLPNAETHLLDTGHFALETHGEEIAGHIETFLLHTSPVADARRAAARISEASELHRLSP
jgi:pimeloyl-ACP methyl ester carboxylesterase